jgi:hypothetical protein
MKIVVRRCLRSAVWKRLFESTWREQLTCACASGTIVAGIPGGVAAAAADSASSLRSAQMGLYGIYDNKHTHPANIALHMIAIPLGFSSVITVWRHPWIALAQIPAAFGLAWIGHAIEGNMPAFLTNPTHVFVAPVWMARKITGRDKRTHEQLHKDAA